MGYNSFNNIKEPVSLDHLTNEFDIHRVSKGNPHLDIKKLDYFNQKQLLSLEKNSPNHEYSIKYLHDLITKEFKECAFDENALTREYTEKIFELVKGRIHKLSDVIYFVPYMFTEPIIYEIEHIKSLIKQTDGIGILLDLIQKAFAKTEFSNTELELFFKDVKVSLNIKGPIENKNIIKIIRYAVTGANLGPPLIKIMETLGKKRILDRINFFKNTMIENTKYLMLKSEKE